MKFTYKKGVFDKAQSAIVIYQVFEVMSKYIAVGVIYFRKSNIW